MRLHLTGPSVALGLCVSLVLIGCGGVDTSKGGPQPSHGGVLLPVGDGAGLVEMVFQPENTKARGKVKGKVAAYFLASDGSGPLDPAPTEVSFTDESGKTYPLSAKAGESSTAGFESEPLTLSTGIDPAGRLELKLGGEAITVENRSR